LTNDKPLKVSSENEVMLMELLPLAVSWLLVAELVVPPRVVWLLVAVFIV
jgi:hypothetical protein